MKYLELFDRSLKRFFTEFHTLWIKLFSKNVKLLPGVKVYYKCRIYNSGDEISVGEDTKLGNSSKHYHCGMPFYTSLLNDGEHSKIIIGKNCRINGAYIHAGKHISIGDNCVIASGVHIIDYNGHMVRSLNRTKGCDSPEMIKIGNNVWIGINSIILKGTVIGNNCVVSAGSVVKGVFEDNTMIQGNPAVVTSTINIIR